MTNDKNKNNQQPAPAKPADVTKEELAKSALEYKAKYEALLIKAKKQEHDAKVNKIVSKIKDPKESFFVHTVLKNADDPDKAFQRLMLNKDNYLIKNGVNTESPVTNNSQPFIPSPVKTDEQRHEDLYQSIINGFKEAKN